MKKVLDIGCATGLLGLAVIGDAPERTGVLFDQLPPYLIEESVGAAGLTGRAIVVSGNFMTDDLGSGYDLILVVSEGIQRDLTGPWDMMMGYLLYYFQGMDMSVLQNEVVDAAKKVGFTKFEKRTELLCSGTQDIDIIRK